MARKTFLRKWDTNYFGKLTEAEGHHCDCKSLDEIGNKCNHEPGQCPNPATKTLPDAGEWICDQCADRLEKSL